MLPRPPRVIGYRSDANDPTPQLVIVSHKSAKLLTQSASQALERSLHKLREHEEDLLSESPKEYRVLLLEYDGLNMVLESTEALMTQLANCKKWNIMKYRRIRKDVSAKSLDLFLDSLDLEYRIKRTSNFVIARALHRRETTLSQNAINADHSIECSSSVATNKGKGKMQDNADAVPDPSSESCDPPAFETLSTEPGTSGVKSFAAQPSTPRVTHTSWEEHFPSEWKETEDEGRDDCGERSRTSDREIIV